MKKGIIAFASVIAIGCVTGCGGKKNQVVCTGKVSEGSQTYEAKIVAKLKDNKVNDGYMEMKFSDQKTADTMCGMMKLANSMAEDESKKIDFTCKGKTLKINSLESMESEDSDDKIIGMTKEAFIKQATSSSKDVKCK